MMQMVQAQLMMTTHLVAKELYWTRTWVVLRLDEKDEWSKRDSVMSRLILMTSVVEIVIVGGKAKAASGYYCTRSTATLQKLLEQRGMLIRSVDVLVRVVVAVGALDAVVVVDLDVDASRRWWEAETGP
ncbi:hypothetical protein PHYSODRAFT_324193 [Phytophthora sojae]|uniref:Uncharacterized protein n=1 Tax=Phytophthora sojae (strain P6497) TaxID=1094619 RepID=G4YRG6_PHYSP|nr:hypothetical protein PHYSODRAFT_324193 [Phytophthora sojae]EGZ22900.1 hypothetical protein PHYSODRAFT_324193 [Phytophthora sojae]|eukprot:XP_009518188.1 hypothetical protein PHYSODRAFT_324193 [Phytophthora sojae]